VVTRFVGLESHTESEDPTETVVGPTVTTRAVGFGVYQRQREPFGDEINRTYEARNYSVEEKHQLEQYSDTVMEILELRQSVLEGGKPEVAQ